MATTHWGAVSAYPEAGRIREQELKKGFWAKALSHGACYKRIQSPQCDIKDTIEYILAKQFEAVATQIQEELVELDKRVSQTKAGQKLIDTQRIRSGLRVPALAAQKLKDPVRRDSSRYVLLCLHQFCNQLTRLLRNIHPTLSRPPHSPGPSLTHDAAPS
jgi:hypothetical protein